MGLLDLIFKRKESGSLDEQLKREAVMQEQQVINNEKVNGEFIMEIEDVFTITGRGTIITGRITSGKVYMNDVILNKNTGKSYTVTGIEIFRKTLDYAQAGDNVGLLLASAERTDFDRGNMMIK